MNTHLSRVALALSAMTAIGCLAIDVSADEVCCEPVEPVIHSAPVVYVTPAAPSWIFKPSTFSHDPATGARVAQYMRKPPVEPLDDQRAVTSRYRRMRTVLRGPQGSYDTTYQVQAWGNNGGIDAQWQAFHDAWKESILSGGFYNQNRGQWNNGFGNGWNNGWNNGWGSGPGWNNGWNNGPGWGNGFPNGPNGGWNGGPNGGWNQGNGPHGGNGQPHDHWPNDDDASKQRQD